LQRNIPQSWQLVIAIAARFLREIRRILAPSIDDITIGTGLILLGCSSPSGFLIERLFEGFSTDGGRL